VNWLRARSKMTEPSREVLLYRSKSGAEIALKVAMAKAVDEHARLGLSVYIWRNSKVVELFLNKTNRSSRRRKYKAYCLPD